MKYELDNEENLFDALDGLYAYDRGSTDSGIKDEVLREACKVKLEEIREDGISESQLYSARFSGMIGRFIQARCLSPEAIKQGYGYEDMRNFLEWLHRDMKVLD
jgi:hypothetical protein